MTAPLMSTATPPVRRTGAVSGAASPCELSQKHMTRLQRLSRALAACSPGCWHRIAGVLSARKRTRTATKERAASTSTRRLQHFVYELAPLHRGNHSITSPETLQDRKSVV